MENIAEELIDVYPWLRKPGVLLQAWAPGGKDAAFRLRVVKELGTHTICVHDGGSHPEFRLPNDWEFLPDLSDPATAGVILSLLGESLRSVAGPAFYGSDKGEDKWSVWVSTEEFSSMGFPGHTLGLAAARALIAKTKQS